MLVWNEANASLFIGKVVSLFVLFKSVNAHVQTMVI